MEQGYWLAAADGGVFSFGQAPFVGSAAGVAKSPVVGIAPAVPWGYVLASKDGGVFAFGSAKYQGSAAGRSTAPFVGIAMELYGTGAYRLTDNKGMIFRFGDGARDHGDLRGQTLAAPIVGIQTPALAGADRYWLVGRDGAVYPFGDAKSYGSASAQHPNAPIVGMTPSLNGTGYWLVASDGGVFAFGDARFFGSTGNLHLNAPIVGIASTARGDGYWLVAADGGVFTFGNAQFFGSTGNLKLNAPIIGIGICTGPGGIAAPT